MISNQLILLIDLQRSLRVRKKARKLIKRRRKRKEPGRAVGRNETMWKNDQTGSWFQKR